MKELKITLYQWFGAGAGAARIRIHLVELEAQRDAAPAQNVMLNRSRSKMMWLRTALLFIIF
jgi:hypothetical protein